MYITPHLSNINRYLIKFVSNFFFIPTSFTQFSSILGKISDSRSGSLSLFIFCSEYLFMFDDFNAYLIKYTQHYNTTDVAGIQAFIISISHSLWQIVEHPICFTYKSICLLTLFVPYLDLYRALLFYNSEHAIDYVDISLDSSIRHGLPIHKNFLCHQSRDWDSFSISYAMPLGGKFLVNALEIVTLKFLGWNPLFS